MPSETPEEFEAGEDRRLATIAEIVEVSMKIETSMMEALDLVKQGIETHRRLLVELSNLVDGS